MNLNATLVAQLVVFFILAWVTMKFVWPPIAAALDERASKIADGLAAAIERKKLMDDIRKNTEAIESIEAKKMNDIYQATQARKTFESSRLLARRSSHRRDSRASRC